MRYTNLLVQKNETFKVHIVVYLSGLSVPS